MTFQWDEAKNEINIMKHGIDFTDAWQVFEHPLFVWIDDQQGYGEDRWIGLGMLNNLVIVFIAYVEQDEECIRVISMRKAKKHERERYERAVKDRLGAS